MKWKNNILALAVSGCLLAALAACGSQSSSSTNGERTRPIQGSMSEREEEETLEGSIQIAQESGEGDDENSDDVVVNSEPDDSEDGEARDEITLDAAEQMAKEYYGTEDPDSGKEYSYTMESIEELDGQQYYIYRVSWETDSEDGGAYSKTLNYIFVATDGSAVHTGTGDDDGYRIDG